MEKAIFRDSKNNVVPENNNDYDIAEIRPLDENAVKYPKRHRLKTNHQGQGGRQHRERVKQAEVLNDVVTTTPKTVEVKKENEKEKEPKYSVGSNIRNFTSVKKHRKRGKLLTIHEKNTETKTKKRKAKKKHKRKKHELEQKADPEQELDQNPE
eukprot:293953_1